MGCLFAKKVLSLFLTEIVEVYLKGIDYFDSLLKLQVFGFVSS